MLDTDQQAHVEQVLTIKEERYYPIYTKVGGFEAEIGIIWITIKKNQTSSTIAILDQDAPYLQFKIEY